MLSRYETAFSIIKDYLRENKSTKPLIRFFIQLSMYLFGGILLLKNIRISLRKTDCFLTYLKAL